MIAYRVRVLAAALATVAAGTFAVAPVRIESNAARDDGQARLARRYAESLFNVPQVSLFARNEQSITGPDGRPARELAIELVRYEPAR